jgi:hypothetical protein
VAELVTRRPPNVVTYFGNYASAIASGDPLVHIFMDGDELTFCNLPSGITVEYGTPRVVGQFKRRSCERCFALAQEVRRDV